MTDPYYSRGQIAEQIATLRRQVEALENAHSSAPPCTSIELVPAWRKLVEEQAGHLSDDDDRFLSEVLYQLSEIAALEVPFKQRERLARIVAVAERQVGNGWRAEPPHEVRPPVDVPLLLRCLSTVKSNLYEYSVDWKRLGTYAAAWLRSLTEDGAA